MKTVLSIAGSDSSGGAGIQADIKTIIMHGVYAMTAVTALTAQNTLGVSAVMEVTPEFLAQQIDAVFRDIRPDAVKIGMVPSAVLARVIVERLRHYGAENIVCDPVMVSTSGAQLSEESAVDVMRRDLFPMASLLTPNIPEAQVLSGMAIQTRADMERAAARIAQECHCPVLLKGGHSVCDADDLLAIPKSCSTHGSPAVYAETTSSSCASASAYTENPPAQLLLGTEASLLPRMQLCWIHGERIQNPNTHGTGCTLSSAIASNLALGMTLPDAVRAAKRYISGALAAGLDLGHGSGPLNHAFRLKAEF